MPTPKGGAENKSVTQDTDDTENKGKTPPVNPRDALIQGFAEKVSARHREEQSEAEAQGLGDPPDESAATEAGTESAVATPPGKDAPGTVEDPLAGFVFMQEGKPMVRLKVDGAERLISADEARTMLQKNVAADARLQQAAQLRKDLDARAVQIQAQAADLAQREAKLKNQPPPEDAGDPDLDADSKSLAKVLLTGTEDEVAATVKTVLAKTRQAKAPAIDKNQLVAEVVQTVNASQQATAVQEQVRKDLKKFDTDFEDIVNDKKLYAIADVISDEVKGEHPEWTMSQILTEAGNRTRDYAKGLQKPASDPLPGNRQERKEKLRPMPQSRAGVPAAKEAEQRTTPAQTLAEIRKSRGQAA